MARIVTRYVCQSCGADYPKWSGKCDACGEWNSITEEASSASSTPGGLAKKNVRKGKQVEFVSLEGSSKPVSRMVSKNTEFDRVVGGGLVPGSAVLIGGDPGIGKSTLLTQILAALTTNAGVKCVYISGEEAIDQVRLRAKRLGLKGEDFLLASATSVRDIATTLDENNAPQVVVIDSIQTMFVDSLDSAPGTVSQVRASAQELIQLAKARGFSVLLVGHVTKEGALAGPRVLEHMVDRGLYFEGEQDSRFRIIRAVKNRFGAVNELGVFAMTDRGLKEVSNPSAIFLSRYEHPVPGSVVMVTRDGTRPLLVEVQALVDDSQMGNPRRVAVGLDQNRLAMLLAVLNRHGGVATMGMDVFLNVVGGVKVLETGSDMAVLVAVMSSLRNLALDNHLIVFGEVGLSGEIRPVPNGQERLKEAAKHGFKRAIVPKANAPKDPIDGMDIVGVSWLSEALEAVS